MSGGRPRKPIPDAETALDLLRQGLTDYAIAKRWKMSIMTVHRRLSEERERIEYIDSLRPTVIEEEFRVEVTLENGHEPYTALDITATQAIRKAG